MSRRKTAFPRVSIRPASRILGDWRRFARPLDFLGLGSFDTSLLQRAQTGRRIGDDLAQNILDVPYGAGTVRETREAFGICDRVDER